ncbi:MAG TPA: uroporphyrinogen decarboxylase family protein [Candidatus Hydrogenedentes bacterium]|nr:uroporphyrinogen decarboxylase family protein [Candidatus Hydrogenedentota bacterium]HOS01966.1 uroporphyrinogen decarboxylase family protein [Candidatus Hydrogenedentota bacterium]
MTHRERVRTALAHRQPDRVPYNVQFTDEARDMMAQCCQDPDFEQRLDNSLAYLSLRKALNYREVEPDIWEDEFGVRWDQSADKSIGVVCNRIVSPDSLDDYAFPDPHAPARYAGIPKLIAQYPGRFTAVNYGFSLFERAWPLAGMEEMLVYMMCEPEFSHDLFDRILDFNLGLIDEVCAFDIDAMIFGDDWGQQTGLLMGVDLWREYIKPRVAQMYQRVKAHGKAVMIHSCGKVDELFPELIEIGVDVFNPFQPEVMDVYAMKRLYGDRLSFYGGISTQQTLPFASVSEVRREVGRLLEEVGKDGGFIAAPAHWIPRDARPENIAAMLDVLTHQ